MAVRKRVASSRELEDLTSIPCEEDLVNGDPNPEPRGDSWETLLKEVVGRLEALEARVGERDLHVPLVHVKAAVKESLEEFSESKAGSAYYALALNPALCPMGGDPPGRLTFCICLLQPQNFAVW
jgi:hypothetical protein